MKLIKKYNLVTLFIEVYFIKKRSSFISKTISVSISLLRKKIDYINLPKNISQTRIMRCKTGLRIHSELSKPRGKYRKDERISWMHLKHEQLPAARIDRLLPGFSFQASKRPLDAGPAGRVCRDVVVSADVQMIVKVHG